MPDFKNSRKLEHPKCVFVTGGLGFIGSRFIRTIFDEWSCFIHNVDNASYGSDPSSVFPISKSDRYIWHPADIRDEEKLRRLLLSIRPSLLVHFAAETHVDHSIHQPKVFIETNVLGTFNVLQSATNYFNSLDGPEKDCFRVINVSTDEVFGDIGLDSKGIFNENSRYRPNSPYSASKAAADHMARAWFKTFNLPVITTNCTNNYGEWQAQDKFIPKIINSTINCEPIPVYGSGKQVRDWIYVGDHIDALIQIARHGAPGEQYLIGAKNPRRNIDIVNMLLDIIASKTGQNVSDLQRLISPVKDRLGHDFRYEVDNSKLVTNLKWEPTTSFNDGLIKTVDWYLSQIRCSSSYVTRGRDTVQVLRGSETINSAISA